MTQVHESEQQGPARVLLCSGPNLNLLGTREPDIYGRETLADLEDMARAAAQDLNLELVTMQTNAEVDIVDAIQKARGAFEAIIINPGAFTHYAWGLHDALRAYEGIKIELHISNPAARETWRHTSVVSSAVTATIAGLGPVGYPLAVAAAANLIADERAVG